MGTLPRHGRSEVVTDAGPDAVWALVQDPTRVGEWSHECQGAEWIDGATEARPGARFRGRNKQRWARWARVNEVVSVDAPRSISWRTVPSVIYPDSTIWTITVEPASGGTRIEQQFEVVKINPLLDRLFYAVMPAHRDRTEALTDDLRRLGEAARHAADTGQSR